ATGPAAGVEDRPLAARRRAQAPADDSLSVAEHQSMMALAGELSAINGSAIRDALTSPDAPVSAALRAIRESLGAIHVSAWRLDAGRLDPVGVAGPPAGGLVKLPST